MDLKQLKAIGAFANSTLIPFTKSWTTPEGEEIEFSFFVVRRSFGQAEEFYKMSQEKRTISASATLIAETIRLGDKGQERLSYDQAYGLEPSLASVFFDAITEASTPKKASSAENSGTN